MQRVLSLLVMIVMVLTVLQPHAADASGIAKPVSAQASVSGQAQFAVRHDMSPVELRGVPVMNATETKPDRMPLANFAVPKKVVDRSTIILDPALQAGSDANKKYTDPPMPGLDTGFNGANQGTNRTVNGQGVLPPDTNGDVSANNYIQTVNNVFTVWDLNSVNPYTGLPMTVYGPARISSLFAGFGGACELWDDGDPVVVYDHLADRWLITQFALGNYPAGPYSECIAISASGDPLGSWYRYEFQFDVMNDYPKFGVWPDGYYMTMNQFDPTDVPSSQWRGQGVVVYERDVMLTGGDARMIYIDTYTGCTTGAELPRCILGGMLPSDLDGPVPATGEPNFFSQFDDDAGGYSPDQLQIWAFSTDWTAGVGTFAHVVDLPVAAFDSEVCLGYARSCIQQPLTTQGVDAISDRLMFRLQYRNFGTYQTLVTNHTVDVNDPAGHAGVRWYELRKVAGVWGVYQQGTYSPDASSRWMGSIAMDGSGNIALGYSVSDAVSVYPSIRYAGRFASDPLGTLPQGESNIKTGLGYQSHSAARWGDYSAMVVSPADDCEFWYTQEYNNVNSSAEWYTYIAAFTFAPPATPGTAGCTPHSPFADVFDTDYYAPFVYRLYDLGISTGCGSGNFCPDSNVTRAEMAVFILRTIHGGMYVPPAVGTDTGFADVPITYWAAAWIKQLAAEGITGGCGGGNYCPDSDVTRAEMSVFLLRMEHGVAYAPPAATGLVFLDVPASAFAAAWIEQLSMEGITGGCGGGNFCPSSPVTRAQMAIFLIRTLELMP